MTTITPDTRGEYRLFVNTTNGTAVFLHPTTEEFQVVRRVLLNRLSSTAFDVEIRTDDARNLLLEFRQLIDRWVPIGEAETRLRFELADIERFVERQKAFNNNGFPSPTPEAIGIPKGYKTLVLRLEPTYRKSIGFEFGSTDDFRTLDLSALFNPDNRVYFYESWKVALENIDKLRCAVLGNVVDDYIEPIIIALAQQEAELASKR